MVKFNQLPTNEQIGIIAKRNGRSTTVRWKSDQTKNMNASYKSFGTLTKEVRMTLTTDKKYENTKAYDNHEHTGNSWMERVECEANGIIRHKKTGRLYVQMYPIKRKNGGMVNPVECHWFLNGREISTDDAKVLLVASKRNSSEMDMICLPLDSIETISGM